jgi:hypothetical protein
MSARSPEQDLAVVQSFASRRPYEAQQARFFEWYGWRPSAARTCLRVFAGKRCTKGYAVHYSMCICDRHYHILDHICRWRTQDGRDVLTADPYEFAGDEFAALVADCAELGLEARVTGTSPYFPGRTVLIVIERSSR